jgi:hypothetical protein
MYFKTGQVIFVPEWPKGEFVIYWPHSVFGQKCKDAENRDSTYQSIFRRLCTAKKVEEFKFPVSHQDDRAIPSRLLSVNSSIRPDDVPYRQDARHNSIILPNDVFRPSGPYTVSRSIYANLHTSGRLSSPSGRLSVIDQLQILSKFRIRED